MKIQRWPCAGIRITAGESASEGKVNVRMLQAGESIALG